MKNIKPRRVMTDSPANAIGHARGVLRQKGRAKPEAIARAHAWLSRHSQGWSQTGPEAVAMLLRELETARRAALVREAGKLLRRPGVSAAELSAMRGRLVLVLHSDHIEHADVRDALRRLGDARYAADRREGRTYPDTGGVALVNRPERMRAPLVSAWTPGGPHAA